MLCWFAHHFPPRVAEFLERDRHLSRNFREESVTDLLMAGLIGLEPFGIRVDFPDEPETGGDMEWIYTAPRDINGGRYLRLILQAKRAKISSRNADGYWFYNHLDHGDPAGQQAQTLLQQGNAQNAPATLPLYIFYHPTSALAPAYNNRPAVEGINIVFASLVAPVVLNGCTRAQKKVDFWRDHFMPLSDLLCWNGIVGFQPPFDPLLPFGFHPDLVARRFQLRARAFGLQVSAIEASSGIPSGIQRAIDDQITIEDRRALTRPRVILSTPLTRSDIEI